MWWDSGYVSPLRQPVTGLVTYELFNTEAKRLGILGATKGRYVFLYTRDEPPATFTLWGAAQAITAGSVAEAKQVAETLMRLKGFK